MPTVDNHGIAIHFEVRGHGDPVVLLHGFTAASGQWEYAGIAGELEKHYRVILIDLRGHGRSTKPHDPQAYTLEHRLSDINAVLDALDLERAHFLGYSMGGWLAFGMAARYPDRVASLMVGGAHPFDEPATPFHPLTGEDPQAFVDALETFIGETIAEAARPLVLKNDLKALVAAAVDRHDQSADLAGRDLPVFLFVGEQDQRLAAVKQAAERFNAELHILPKVGHAMTLFSGPKLVHAIMDFLSRFSQSRPLS